MMVGLGERRTPSTRAVPAAPAVLGMYRNGDQRVEVVEKDGKLVVRRGAAETPFSGFATVPGADGRVEYLWQGSRAMARVR